MTLQKIFIELLRRSSFPLDEYVLEQFLGDDAMGPGGTLGRPLVQSAVDGVELGAELAAHVEPPVADKDGLTKLRTVGTEEGCLTAVDVAVMPGLAARLHVGEEARVGLVIAVELGVRHLAQDGVVRARPTCKYN